jgi:uncharacterized protein
MRGDGLTWAEQDTAAVPAFAEQAVAGRPFAAELAGTTNNNSALGVRMGVAERFYDAFMVRDHYTMGLLYAEHATFSDPVFPLLNAKGARLMWQMLLARAGDDFGIEVKIREDSPKRAIVDWVAYYKFSATGRPVENRIHTEMGLSAGKIVRHQDTFNLWRWSSQALGTKGALLGWTPMVRDRIRAQAAASLRDFARRLAAGQPMQEES